MTISLFPFSCRYIFFMITCPFSHFHLCRVSSVLISWMYPISRPQSMLEHYPCAHLQSTTLPSVWKSQKTNGVSRPVMPSTATRQGMTKTLPVQTTSGGQSKIIKVLTCISLEVRVSNFFFKSCFGPPPPPHPQKKEIYAECQTYVFLYYELFILN